MIACMGSPVRWERRDGPPCISARNTLRYEKEKPNSLTEYQAMAEQQSQQEQPGNVTFNYSLDKARVVYGLVEKPADMSDQEWAIVSDEGFRKYLAAW